MSAISSTFWGLIKTDVMLFSFHSHTRGLMGTYFLWREDHTAGYSIWHTPLRLCFLSLPSTSYKHPYGRFRDNQCSHFMAAIERRVQVINATRLHTTMSQWEDEPTKGSFTNMDWFNPSKDKYHTPSKMWDEIVYPFPNFNGWTVQVWEWTSYFISHFITWM